MIVHRDARCVVVDKPSGLATHRGWDGGDDALLQRVRDAVGCYVYPVHRLDRGASGLVVFALDHDAARTLSLAWAEADKRYLAITRGHPPEHVVIDHPVLKEERGGDSLKNPARASTRKSDASASFTHSATIRPP